MIEVRNRDMSITLKVIIFFAYDDIHYKKNIKYQLGLIYVRKTIKINYLSHFFRVC